jgi:hypothetical protein
MITGFGGVPFKPLAIGGGVDLMRDWQRESRVTVVPIPGSNTSDTFISVLGPPLLTLPVETPTQADYQALQLRLLSVGTLTLNHGTATGPHTEIVAFDRVYDRFANVLLRELRDPVVRRNGTVRATATFQGSWT